MARRDHSSSEGETKGGWSILWAMTARYRFRMLLLALVSFLGALLEAGFLVLLTTTILGLASGGAGVAFLGRSIPVELATVVGWLAIICRLALSLAGVRVAAALTARVTTDQRQRVSHAYLGTSWSIQQTEPAGRLQELLTSFVSRASGAMSAVTQGISASLSLAAFLSTGILVDRWSTVAVVAALALLGAVLAPLRRRIRRRSSLATQSNLDFANAVSELGMLGQEMQTFGVQSRFAERIDALTHKTTEYGRQVQVFSGALSPVYTSLAYAAILTGIAVISTVGLGDMAAIGSVMLLMLRSLSYGQQLLGVMGNLAASLPTLERLGAVVRTYETNRASNGQRVPGDVTPIEVDQVSFAYSQERPALEGLTLSIRRGEVIGVIGPSGAGKSTLAQLLLGLRLPTRGSIRVAGVDLKEIDRTAWTDRVSFVPQEALLFTGTVAENIRFFRTGLDDPALNRAAQQANILTDIQNLPLGFDTHLGERGSQLSGGQRQRLSIARALAGEPSLLILDEPTSALDGQSEILIRDALANLRGHITVVIIAHRMSTLDLCDRIAVIEGGRMTALDSPAKLRERSAFYRRALDIAGMT